MLHGLLSDPATQQRMLPAGRPRASLTIKPSRSRRVITTELRIGNRTLAWLTWILTPARGTTWVDLALQPEQRGLVTRLALVLGGRCRIARTLERALATLATTAAHLVEHAVEPPAVTGPATTGALVRDAPPLADAHAVGAPA